MPDWETFTLYFDQLPVQWTTSVPPLGDFAMQNLKAVPIGGYDDPLKRAFYEFTTKILAGKIVSKRQEFTFEFPATWWQHWKQAHADRWYARRIVRRWPVKMTAHRNAVDFTQYAAYPLAELPVAPPGKFGQPVIWEMSRLRRPLEAGMTQVHLNNPRAVFMKRRWAEYAVREIIWQQSVHTDVPSSFDPAYIRYIFDALQHLGVNTDQLITETALEDRDIPLPEEK